MTHSSRFRVGRLMSAVVMAGSLSAFALTAGISPAAANSPGNPGTPAAPVELFHEDFENGVSTSHILLPSYNSATSGVTYTANPYYLDKTYCDGLVTSYNSTDFASDPTVCSGNSGYYDWARQFAKALGGGTSNTNHAVVDFTTDNAVSPANGVELDSNGAVATPAANRYLTVSMDVAEAFCGQSGDAKFDFFLTDGSGDHDVQSSSAVPCTDSSFNTVTVDGKNFKTGNLFANGSFLSNGTALGVKVINTIAVGGGVGNDLAFDNVKLYDATPQLDQTFADPSIPVGSNTTLTYTITNTSELAAKSNFAFSDDLPNGLTIVGSPTTTCGSGVADALGQTISLSGGDLGSGEASCTVTVTVTATSAGTYSNPGSSVTRTGLDEPGNASVEFAEVVDVPMLNPTVAAGALALIVLGGAAFIVRRRMTGTSIDRSGELS